MEKYILIGLPGCGKSALGEKAAKSLKLPFYDTNEMTIESLNLDHPIELLRYKRSQRFYHRQHDVIRQLKYHVGPAIVATGSEVMLMPQCTPLLKELGTLIYIERSVKDIVKEVKEKERDRAHIVIHIISDDGLSEKSASVEAIKLHAKKSSQYTSVADVILNNDASENEGVNRLARVIERLIRVQEEQKKKEGVSAL